VLKLDQLALAAGKGAAAGLVGTALLTAAGRALPAASARLGAPMPEDVRPDRHPEGEPTQKLAQEVAVGVADRPLDREERQTAGEAIHWTYGALWGALYGLAQSQLRLPHLLHGTLFGALVGTVASTVVPAIGLSRGPMDQPAAKSGMQLGLHLLYGLGTALVFRLLDGRDRSVATAADEWLRAGRERVGEGMAALR
jgi:hypothetical protein